MIVIAVLIALVILIFVARRGDAAHWHPSAVWMKQALCVHRHEAAWNDPDAPYYGGMQFALSTWQRAGGHGYPHQASIREQLYRAWVIWRKNGGSWHEWPTYARYCV